MFGIGFMLFPTVLSELITEASPTTPAGVIDMRATYGGVSAGLGLLLLFLDNALVLIQAKLLGIMFVVGGMALGRFIGMLIDGSPNMMMYAFLLLEIVVIALTLTFYISNKGQDDSN